MSYSYFRKLGLKDVKPANFKLQINGGLFTKGTMGSLRGCNSSSWHVFIPHVLCSHEDGGGGGCATHLWKTFSSLQVKLKWVCLKGSSS